MSFARSRMARRTFSWAVTRMLELTTISIGNGAFASYESPRS
ncbi:hypothetical protein [Arthrobacter cheniae]|nr:hypothetical protein [Arthrobacter cheniae]